MEISLDISHRRQLEVDLQKSEKKYHAIFSNIPNPVFVLDVDRPGNHGLQPKRHGRLRLSPWMRSRQILHDPFPPDEQDHYAFKRHLSVINQARHLDRKGKGLFVNIRISPSEYSGQKVLLVTTSDITKRLETEQQLIQASKMATLGEMATGVAHELNQPLSVIKTVSSFFMKKLGSSEREASPRMSVHHAGQGGRQRGPRRQIINHMRQFARKSDMEKVQSSSTTC
jgi:histidine kinase